MITVRIHGGVGNQMFQYACARALSIKQQQDVLLDLSFYPAQSLRAYRLNEFCLHAEVASEQHLVRVRGREGLRFKAMRRMGRDIKRPAGYKKERGSGVFDEHLLDSAADIYLDGYWQNERYFSGIKRVLQEDFALKEPLGAVARNYLEKIQAGNAVSLHVRRGDYVSNAHTNAVHGVCSLDYYQRAVELMQTKVDSPVFFVFSDDIPWCRENLKLEAPVVYTESVARDVEDLELMKHCAHHIIANSSFSWWGAWLAHEEESSGTVISPELWFSDKARSAVNIASKKWIRL